MNTQELVANRKFLLAHDIRPRGMSDQEIEQKVAEIKAGLKPEPSKRDKPATKKPEPFKVPEGMPEQDAKPEPVKPESKPTNGSKPDTGALAGSIERIIQDALGSTQQIDEPAIIALIEKHSKAPTRIEHEITIKRPDGLPEVKITGAHPVLQDVIDCATVGENVYLYGPAASGKTTIGAQVAEALGYEFFFTGSVSDEFKLTGFTDANGTYHERAFYKALKAVERGAQGAVFLFDEIDGSIPTALVAINAALENGYFAFDHETVYFDKSKVFFLAAANTIGKGANREYVGRYPIDEATRNRFYPLEMNYDLNVEMSMAEQAWLEAGGKEDRLNVAQEFCHEVIAFRRQLNEKNIKVLISPRHTRRGAKLLAIGWKLNKVRQSLYNDLNADHCKTLGVTKA